MVLCKPQIDVGLTIESAMGMQSSVILPFEEECERHRAERRDVVLSSPSAG